jgi:hypothetical protein
MPNPSSQKVAPARRLSAPDERLEAAATRCLEAQRGRKAIAPPPRAAGLAVALLRPLLKDAGASLSDLQRSWPEIVGERLSGLTYPEKLQRGDAGATLTVRAHASAAPFVQHQQTLIIERANLAGAGLKAIQIKQGALPLRPSNLRPVTRPLSPDEERALAATLGAIKSDRLRAALMRLGRAVSAG